MAAKRTIEINGKTYNKCCISNEQWEGCLTPCIYCHREVQNVCDTNHPFCGNERACFIDLGAIYGEED